MATKARSSPTVSLPAVEPPTGGNSLAGDSFRRNLAWSAGIHGALLGVALLGLDLDRSPGLLPASAAFIELGMSGPHPTPNLGGASAPADPPPPPLEELPPEEEPPEAPPDPEPAEIEPEEPEPPPDRPEVVRPTVENRERMPVPDARARRRALRPERPESGLRGRDAAWADSARLETRRPIDRSSRPTRRTPPTNQRAGAADAGLGGVPGSARFDQDFEYSYYQRQMVARIHRNWQQIPVRGEAKVLIRFTIDRAGGISGAEVETSSGQDLLDRAALRAVVLAEPLPPLPDSYPRDRVGVHLLFTYRQSADSAPTPFPLPTGNSS